MTAPNQKVSHSKLEGVSSTYQEGGRKAYQATRCVGEGDMFPEVVVPRIPEDVDELRGITDVLHGW
jgi:hypothetical protein